MGNQRIRALAVFVTLAAATAVPFALASPAVAAVPGQVVITEWMVRNLLDGGVEAVFEGRPELVDALVAWCEHGPASADVRRVRVVDEHPRGETIFRVI
jgi:hypothetical protein